MNVKHRKHNQQILLKSLGTTPSPGGDKNHSRCFLRMYMSNFLYNVNKYERPHSPSDVTLRQDQVCGGLYNGPYGNWSVATTPCFLHLSLKPISSIYLRFKQTPFIQNSCTYFGILDLSLCMFALAVISLVVTTQYRCEEREEPANRI